VGETSSWTGRWFRYGTPYLFYRAARGLYRICATVFTSVAQGHLRVVTSTVTLLEVLVLPIRLGDEALAFKYNDILLSAPNISTLPVTRAIAQSAAELRARYNLKTPDSIQLAVAIGEGATAFLTNDRRIPDDCGIRILRLENLDS
jgi:predicted nucleic acid-binding protein